MLKIWGRQNSSNVRKVIWCCDELDIAYQREDIGGAAGGLDDTWYLALNPNRVIPTIDHDGFVLWESNAIVRYLCGLYGHGSLYPADPRQRAIADRWMDWQITTLRPPLVPLALDWIYERPLDAGQCELLKPIWEVLEQYLVHQKYVAGDRFTMGDIPVALMAHWWYEFPIDHHALPGVESWYARICERPVFRRHVLNQPYGPASDH